MSSCEIVLEQPPVDVSQVNVAVDCVVVAAQGQAFGWHFDNNSAPTTIILDGEICDRIRTVGAQRIDTLFGCPTIF